MQFDNLIKIIAKKYVKKILNMKKSFLKVTDYINVR